MSTYRFGKFELDTRRRVLRDGDRELALSTKLFALLSCFVKSGGGAVCKDELAAQVWPYEEPSDATIVQHVMLLRKLLGDSVKSREYILTLPGRGYAFVAQVSLEPPAVLKRRARAGTETVPEAFREYLAAEQACIGAAGGSAAGLKLSLQHYQRALKLDPGFAPAWIGVASMQSFMAYYGYVPWSSVLDTALHAASTAIELDPQSSLAHCLLSQLHFVHWDLRGSLRLLERGAELDPQSPHPHHLSAFIRKWCGDFEAAISDAKRSLALDASDILTQDVYANALATQGDLHDAIFIYSNILEAHPDSQVTRQARCDAYAGDEQFHLALRDLEQLPRSAPNVSRLGCLHALTGDRLLATRMLNELQRRASREYVEPHCIAQLHIALGHYEEAMALAHRAIELHDFKFPGMLDSPLLSRPMRDKRIRAKLSDFNASLRWRRKATG